jgi:LysM repeat protein
MKMEIKKFLIVTGLVIVGLVLLGLPGRVLASNPAQDLYQTPTALPDGSILYTVKTGETCLSISLLTGVSIDEIKKLNNLGSDCAINAGQKLLIALVAPATPTSLPGASPTAGTVVPSATPFRGNGQVCVEVFEDVNGDALRQDSEGLISNAAVSLTDRLGTVSKTGMTDNGTTALCFPNIPEGDYNISVAIPEGYNPTTVMNYALHVKAGDQALLDFGAQVSSKAQPLPPAEGGHSSLLGLVGGVFLLIGAGLGVYVLLRMRK